MTCSQYSNVLAAANQRICDELRALDSANICMEAIINEDAAKKMVKMIGEVHQLR
jgi:hypothetical protein